MKAAMLMTGGGSLVILTSHESLTSPALLEKLAIKGIDKFIAYEIPEALARERYGGHYEKLWRHQSGGFIANELDETDEVRALRPAVG